jgi:hypothetical protein
MFYITKEITLKKQIKKLCALALALVNIFLVLKKIFFIPIKKPHF